MDSLPAVDDSPLTSTALGGESEGRAHGTRRESSRAVFAALAGLVLLVLASAFAGCGPVLPPTPNLYLHAAADPFADVPADLRTSDVELLYVTDRAPRTDSKGRLHYGWKRSRSLAFGTCTVTIGHDLSWDELVRQSRETRSRQLPLAVSDIREIARFPDTPTPYVKDDGELVPDPEVERERLEESQVAYDFIAERLEHTPRKEVFLYVHGYNNDFDVAAERLASIWHFLGRPGVPVLYTWPAGRGGLIRGYNYDRESGEFTIYHLKQALRFLAAMPGLEKIHVIAHSRGTDVFMTALRELHLEYRGAGEDTREQLKLGEVILAAADIDMEVSSQRYGAERVTLVPERLTLYLSAGDRALGSAEWLFGDSGSRIGHIREEDLSKVQLGQLELFNQIQVVDVRVKTDFLGHGYFVSNPAVLSDVILVLRDHLEPGAENGRPLIRHGKNEVFWELDEGYLEEEGTKGQRD